MADHEQGIPVLFGGSGVIRFLTEESIQKTEFSKGFHSLNDINLSFTGLDLESALILVARAARIDIAIPRGLAGKVVSGRLKNVDWQEALATILAIANEDLKPVRRPNGLVQFQKVD